MLSKNKLKISLLALLVFFLATSITSCSPLYVMEASWEQMKILSRREPIKDLVKEESLDKEELEKLALVLEARSFAQTLGMDPGGSFKKYADIKREVLLWVLSGSSKTSFSPVTWWFPFVGTVPYKGFFDKDDAYAAAKELQERNLDIFLRTSPAFSTLGWFDDPLLSTTLKFRRTSLVNTVIHEILHNTVWVKGSASFNESLANFVGTVGAQEFFKQKGPEYSEDVLDLAAQWRDEVRFSKFLVSTKKSLDELYSKGMLKKDNPNFLSEEKIMEERLLRYAEIEQDWKSIRQSFESRNYQNANIKLNNATVVAYMVYLDQPLIFQELFDALDSNLPAFIKTIKGISAEVDENGGDPYQTTQAKIQQLRSSPTSN